MMFRALHSIQSDIVKTDDLYDIVEHIHQQIHYRTGVGSDFLGWLDLSSRMESDAGFWQKLDALRQRFYDMGITDVVVIGIGGSYLGTRALYEIFRPRYASEQFLQLHFAGHHLNSKYHELLLKWLEERNFALIVISKSGTTLEPALAFRLLRQKLIEKYGADEANKRIVAITDANKGVLRQMSNAYGWTSFIIEDSVGGRYSVLSPVGIVPLYLCGIDCHQLLKGAIYMERICKSHDELMQNPAIQYAIHRYNLYYSGYRVEILSSFQTEYAYFIEWWKQLYGESEGKDRKGLFPAGAIFSTDLHSLGQFIQEGTPMFFETFLIVKQKPGYLLLTEDAENADGLNYLSGKTLGWIESMAEKGTILAHHEGGVPVQMIIIDEQSEYELGRLIYFFEFACAVSGYLLGVNPFDQPGVEAYKKNMFTLLGKPGTETERASIEVLINKLGLTY